MNKKRLEQILTILVLPYIDKAFAKNNEFIKNNRKAFWNLKYHSNHLNRKESEKNYYNTEKQISLFFQSHPEYQIKNLDDIKLLLELFFPEEKLVEQMQYYSENKGKDVTSCIDRLYLANIYEIAKSLLTFRDGKIAIRTWLNPENDIFNYPSVFDKIEIWNQLGRLMTTDIIIAAFFVLCDLREEYYLFNQSGIVMLADKTLEQVFKKGLAETHLHFNAGVDFQYLWQHRMNPRSWRIEERRKQFFKISRDDLSGFPIMIYRICWAAYLENGENKQGFFKYVNSNYGDTAEYICYLLSKICDGDLASANEEVERDWKIYSVLVDKFVQFYESKYDTQFSKKGQVECETDDFLFRGIFKLYEQYHTSGELILLLKSLWYFQEAESEVELRLFLQYVRCKNLFFGAIVRLKMVEGLANFRNTYANMIVRLLTIDDTSERFNVIFKSISQSIYLKKLEIRISPPLKFQDYGVRFLDNQSVRDTIRREYLYGIRNILRTFKKSMLESAGLSFEAYTAEDYQTLDKLYIENRVTIPTIGIVFHFLKRNHIDNRTGDTCWLENVDTDAPAYKNTIAMRQAMMASARILEELRSSIPLLSDYVVGLDAASEENIAEPWVFAPVYKIIRQKRITKPLVQNQKGGIRRNNNLGFTYHVGEEFRHILSGLRHVDEVINEFQYKAGDRLGHALSLGVDIDYWMSQNEAVVIPLQEYLEDLLWLWGKRVYSSWDIQIDINFLEGQIFKFVKLVLGDISGLTMPVIYDAYKLKFENNYKETFENVRKMIAVVPEDYLLNASSEEHFCKFYSVKAPYGLMWTSQKLFCTFFCPVYYSLYNKPILVHVDKSNAELFKAVQKSVIKEVEQKGIYVETNPTSNLAIGELNSLMDLSIVNLNSKGLIDDRNIENEVLATVNSDNPVIFNTNCENEHAYVYHALNYRGFSKERVLRWIEKVRQTGMDSSFIKNIKKPSVQFSEIDELVGFLDRELNVK